MKSFSVRGAGRVGLVAVALVASSFVTVSAASAASIELGQTGSQPGLNCNGQVGDGGPYHAFQASSSGSSYTVPQNGTLTAWSVAETPDEEQTVALEVWRDVSGTWTLEFVSDAQSMPAGTTVQGPFALSPPVEVQTDDVLGLVVTSDSGGCIRSGDTGDVVLQAGGSFTAGDTPPTFDLSQYGDYEVNVSATFVPTPPATLRVKKVVSGTSPGAFVEQVNCTVPTDTALATATVDDVQLAFHADGSPDSTTTPSGWVVSDGTWQLQDAVLTGSTCTVTETVTGGASSVSYACAWSAGVSDNVSGVGCPGASSGPGASPATVTFEGNGDSGLVTVTNTFTPTPAPPTPTPPAAAAVVVTPTFTG